MCANFTGGNRALYFVLFTGVCDMTNLSFCSDASMGIENPYLFGRRAWIVIQLSCLADHPMEMRMKVLQCSFLSGIVKGLGIGYFVFSS
ncbi:hypothetical protein BT93_H3550 [Corymbia citriodora subsp. variegata]|nr:hypothetical protein BT93_H3550 [Corymbia citriodora subsp. variegata]